jgi:hypothetical protein
MKSVSLNSLLSGAFLSLASLTQAQTAQLQVIHNAADPAAASVDIYVNGNIALDNFAFREATNFLTLPSGVPINIGVAGGSSTSAADTLKNFTVTLASGVKYVALANGVLDPASFAPNPDANSTAFGLFIIANAQTAAVNSGDVDFVAVHGSTDAPTVDIKARGVATLVDNADYGAITPYISVPASDYILDVTPASGSPILLSYEANLSTLGGGSAVVFASGFLTPGFNQDGEGFGLFAALADGTVLELPAVSAARLQVIHNAADPAAASVDVYVNGGLALDNFGFREATPYIDVPAGVPVNIGVAPGTSASAADTLKNFTVTFVNGETYLAVANGVLSPASFAANPDQVSTGFTLFLANGMREAALNSSEVDLRVVHGASDAPTVDVFTGASVLVDNAPYAAITPYLSVPASDYILDVKPAADNSITVASYSAPLTGLAGQSIVVLASGFLDPTANQGGQGFTLIAVLEDGTVIPLDLVTSIEDQSYSSGITIFPNPAQDFVTISSKNKNINSVSITDIMGKNIALLAPENNNEALTIPVSTLTSGLYYVTITNDTESIVTKLLVK